MESSIVEWLRNVGTQAFVWSLSVFVVVNAATAMLFLFRRDRALVNRWTGRVLAFDLLLLGTGLGVPLAASLARMTVTLVSASVSSSGLQPVESDGASAIELIQK